MAVPPSLRKAAARRAGTGTAATGGTGGGSGDMLAANNLSDLTSATVARSNLSLGSAALLASSAVLQRANNLSDVASVSAARASLGLGSAATLAASAVAQTANNLSDLASVSAARTNLGLGTAALLAAAAIALVANNLSDLASAVTARSNLGLGTVATLAASAVAQTANNLSDLASVGAARTNLGLGTLATQSGTFSGTSSGTNTGDQTITLTGDITGSGTTAIATSSTKIITACLVVATSSITLSGEQTIDGQLTSGSRVAVVGQASASQNGIYVSGSGAWTRATDWATASQMVAGALVPVLKGSSYGGTVWEFTQNAAVTVGTTSLTWAQVGPATFGTDTKLQLADSASTLVDSWEQIVDLTTATAGSVTSRVTTKLRSAGTFGAYLTLTPSALTVGSAQVYAQNGLQATPSYSFVNNTDMGMYRIGSGNLGLVTGGVSSVSISGGQFCLMVLSGSNARLQFGSGGGSIGIQPTGTQAGSIDITPSSGAFVWIQTSRFEEAKGASIASATTVTLGSDGNYFQITGTTTIAGITYTKWFAGSRIWLELPSGITVTHNSGSPGGAALAIKLRAGADLTTSGVYLLELVHNGSFWLQPG